MMPKFWHEKNPGAKEQDFVRHGLETNYAMLTLCRHTYHTAATKHTDFCIHWVPGPKKFADSQQCGLWGVCPLGAHTAIYHERTLPGFYCSLHVIHMEYRILQDQMQPEYLVHSMQCRIRGISFFFCNIVIHALCLHEMTSACDKACRARSQFCVSLRIWNLLLYEFRIMALPVGSGSVDD